MLTFDGIWHFGEVFSSRMNPGFHCTGQMADKWRHVGEPIVVPFIHDHHLMLQHDNARPHVARICTQFLEAENIPVLAWPAYSPDMSPIEHVWDALDRHIRQRVPVPAICSNFAQPLKGSGPIFHNQQPDQLYAKEMCCTA